jgi:hypothetical protein
MKTSRGLAVMGLGIMLGGFSLLMGGQVQEAKEGRSHHQAWHFPKPPSIKRIGIGSSYTEVIKVFGKPLRINRVAPDRGGVPDLRELHYRNLTVQIYPSEGKSQPYVSSVVIRGSEWTIYPGVKVGMSKEQITRLLSEAPDSDDETDTPWFISFQLNKIPINFYVRLSNDGKVKEIGMAEDWR